MITGPNAEAAVAEMVAALYDASLDAYPARTPGGTWTCSASDSSYVNMQFENMVTVLERSAGQFRDRSEGRDYHLPLRSPANSSPLQRYEMLSRRGRAMFGAGGGMAPGAAPGEMAEDAAATPAPAAEARGERAASVAEGEAKSMAMEMDGAAGLGAGAAAPQVDLSKGLGPQEPERNGLLLPAPGLRRRRRGHAASSPCPRR